jgi:tetratricopeptide (TPR) repeat protein
MEWVDGLCLDEWSSGVTLDQRLRLFIEVCSAVHAAHQNLVVHRDLKPSNILVTSDGRPKLLDFGISRLLGAPDGTPVMTRTALPVMTLAYCSPEQALNLRVGIPTDIYSLGLLLYELASGKRAQDVSQLQLDQALRRIADEDLPRVEGIPQDLEAIIRKAAAKEPSRRYASALELGEDLARFSQGYAVLARPSTLRYSAAKLFRRHRAAVLAGAAGLALALVSLCALAFQYHRAEEERRKAESRFAAVQQLAQVMLFEAPARIAPIPGTITARKWMVERALNYLGQLSSGTDVDPAFAVTIAKGYRQVAFQQFNPNAANLNEPLSAMKSLGQGMAALESVRGVHREVQIEKIENLLARHYSQSGNPDVERADEDAVTKLAEGLDAAGDPAARDLIARIWFKKAVNMRRAESERLELWGRLRAYYTARLAEQPDDPERIRSLALVHKSVSGLYAFRREWAQALEHDHEAMSLDERRLVLLPDDRNVRMDYSFSLGRLGEDLCLAGSRAEGITYLERAVAIRREIVAGEPEDNRARERLAWMLGELGQQRSLNGEVAEGERLVREALDIRGRIGAPGFGENSVPDLHKTLAQAADRRGERRTACAEWRQAANSLPGGQTKVIMQVTGAEEIRAKSRECEER